jgi:serine/threonine-protein kinase
MGTLGGIPLDVGDVLAKKYRLERLVGEGGTGVVVAARHVQLERLVAIKFLRTALASDEIRLRFEREARAIGQIESEHVVLVLDVGTLDDGHSPYMVMEYLEGRDLAKILKEDGPLSIEDAVDCMLQVCEALEGAHAQGIIHRDLKPANLFLTRRDDGGPHIKVVDFGISKILDPKVLRGDRGPSEMTNAFTVLGSPRYMAPEQLRNSKDVDGRADLWSLGAVLFQLLSGHSAFDADNNIHVSLAVLTNEPTLLRSVAPHVPPALEAIVNKCLTKDRARRFQSAAELADALEPFGSDRTRESLDRLQQAKQAPSVDLSMKVASEGQRVDAGALVDGQSGLTVPLHPPSSPRRMPGDEDARAAAMKSMETGPSAYRLASTPPPAGGPPSSGDPAAAFVRAVRRSPSTTMKLAIAGAGVLLVLLAFVVLTALKMAAESVGVLKSASSEPASPAAGAAPPPERDRLGAVAPARAINGPSQVVTVTLDAGRPPP